MKSLIATLTRSQEEAKSLFLMKLNHLRRVKERPSPEEQVAEYLREVYGVDVPENFPEELCTAHAVFHNGEFHISFELVDAIVYACSLWKEYITKTVDYNRLVCEQVLSMLKIHSSVIATRDIVKTDIELQKQPNCGYSVQVTYGGLIVVYD